jgi:allophanate hydrolase
MVDSNKKYVAVCGLHMRDFPLNRQLTDLQAAYVKTTNTASIYKLYALPTFPEKPGLIKVEDDGYPIEVELWELTYEALGKFLSIIPSPLGLGQITLEDDSTVTGFICEPYIISRSYDISLYKGWRYYRSSLK